MFNPSYINLICLINSLAKNLIKQNIVSNGLVWYIWNHVGWLAEVCVYQMCNSLLQTLIKTQNSVIWSGMTHIWNHVMWLAEVCVYQIMFYLWMFTIHAHWKLQMGLISGVIANIIPVWSLVLLFRIRDVEKLKWDDNVIQNTCNNNDDKK